MTRRGPSPWPEEDLEYLDRCPVCSNQERRLLYSGLVDRLFAAPGRWDLHECLACGCGYLDPRPSKGTIGQAYSRYETHRPPRSEILPEHARISTRLRNGYLNTKYGYSLTPSISLGYLAMYALPPPWRLEWDHYARHLGRPMPGRNRLLDVGCGNGEYLADAQKRGWDAHGIDPDERALQHARAAGVSVTHGDFNSVTFPESSFDFITCQQVIEHVHSPLSFLEKLHSWLKPGGSLWLGTPNFDSRLRKRFGADWHPLHPPQHLVILTPESIKTLLRQAGFKKPRLIPRGYNETHCHRVSFDMQESGDDVELAICSDLLSRRGRRCSAAESFLMEILAWLEPTIASDMVVVAEK